MPKNKTTKKTLWSLKEMNVNIQMSIITAYMTCLLSFSLPLSYKPEWTVCASTHRDSVAFSQIFLQNYDMVVRSHRESSEPNYRGRWEKQPSAWEIRKSKHPKRHLVQEGTQKVITENNKFFKLKGHFEVGSVNVYFDLENLFISSAKHTKVTKWLHKVILKTMWKMWSFTKMLSRQ